MTSMASQVASALCGVLGLWLLWQIFLSVRRRKWMTPLKGPPSKSLFFGVSRVLHASPDSSVLYGEWAKEFGLVYRVPSTFSSNSIALLDPKALAHFHARETVTYVRPAIERRGVERLLGRGLIWAEGESHKRQRKSLTPAFSNAAIRNLTPVFFDSAYKIKSVWDPLIEAEKSSEAAIEVQSWMSHTSLDTIGIAGFSHDFRTLHGKTSEVLTVFEAFSSIKPSILAIMEFLLSPIIPIFARIPTREKSLTRRLHTELLKISTELLANSRVMGGQMTEEKSAIGLLVQAENANTGYRLSPEEVLAQMKVLLVAGYESTSTSLTWTLIELCQRLDVQDRLREELSEFSTCDPTWDQLTNGLPYLDAVVNEVLRLHPAVSVNTRIATKDDILPLSTPIHTRDGRVVDQLCVAEGTAITIPIKAINRCEVFWGPDAKEFKPERWMTVDRLEGAKDLQGYRHLLTFSDGPRICLGKGFALTEMKAVVSTLIRNFSFRLREGSKIEIVKAFLTRPKVAGEKGTDVPLLVRRVE